MKKLFNIKLFSNKLRIAFAVLTFFAVLQAVLTLWVADQSSYHIERSQVANKILSEFIDLGGNKQRLKVWLAQYLLTNDSSVEVKYDLHAKMAVSLKNLSDYLEKDLAMSSQNPRELKQVKEQIERLKTLEINIASLKEELEKVKKSKVFTDTGELWRFLIEIFDNLEGSDLKRLIGDAIEIQKIRAAQAETAASSYIRYFNTSVYLLTALTLLSAFFLSLILQNNLKKPINDLLTATVAMTKGELHHRISDIQENEFGLLASHFNQMASEIEKSRLTEAEKRFQIENEVQQRTLELQNAIEQLKATETERKIFLTNITHELKTPATAIIGEAEVTLRNKNTDVGVYIDTLKNIMMTGRQLSLRIEDLLLLSRGENDLFRLSLQQQPSSAVPEIIESSLRLVNPQGDVHMQANFDHESVEIVFDESRLSQLFVILIENALKYKDKSSDVMARIYVNKNFNIEFINQCEHIHEIDFKRIFDRYYRSTKAKMIRPEGLGVGLSIAHMIVKAHNGRLTSFVGENSTFVSRIELPLEGGQLAPTDR